MEFLVNFRESEEKDTEGEVRLRGGGGKGLATKKKELGYKQMP